MRLSTLSLLATSLLVGAPLAAETLEGQPCVFNFNDQPWFLLRTSAGALIPAPGLMPAQLPNGLPPAMGTPVAATGMVADGSGGATGRLHLTYRGKGGGIYDIGLFDRKAGKADGGEWRVRHLNPGGAAAQGRPATLLAGGDLRVVYRDVDGGIVDLPAQGGAAIQLNLGGRTDAPAAGGDPVQIATPGAREVFYADADGIIWCLYEEDSKWSFAKLSNGGATLAPAAGGPLTVFASSDALNLVYADAAGKVFAISRELATAAWSSRQLNAGGDGVTSAPAAAVGRSGAAIACLPTEDGGFRVAYRTAGGGLVQIRHLGEAFKVLQLNDGGLTKARKAVSDPAFQPGLAGGGCFLNFVDDEGDLSLCAAGDGSDKSWSSATVFEHKAIATRGGLETKAESKGDGKAATGSQAVECKQATGALAPSSAVLVAVLADTGERVMEAVDAFVAKQVADHQSREAQGKLVGRDLAKVTSALAGAGDRAKEAVDGFVAKQEADLQSRREQGKVVGRDLARIIGKDATRFLNRWH